MALPENIVAWMLSVSTYTCAESRQEYPLLKESVGRVLKLHVVASAAAHEAKKGTYSCLLAATHTASLTSCLA